MIQYTCSNIYDPYICFNNEICVLINIKSLNHWGVNIFYLNTILNIVDFIIDNSF